MSIRIQIIVAIVVILAVCLVFHMIKKNRIRLKYALPWMAMAVGILLLDLFPQLITILANKMGVGVPINMLFFFGFCCALLIIFILTVQVSSLSEKVKTLAQEIALLEASKGIKDGDKNSENR